MFRPIRFPQEMEGLVRFVEETAPDRIIEATLLKLREGLSPQKLLTAGALAVIRSTELPPEHHGGPVHPVCGIHAVYHTSLRLPGRASYVPLVQHTALCNNHINSSQMGPYILPEIDPLENTGEVVGSYHLGESHSGLDGKSSASTKDKSDSTEEAFIDSIQTRKASAAEQYCLWLLEKLPPNRVLDLLLPAAVSRNNIDDHYFLYPMFTSRALDCIGWEWAPVLMRPVVRYQARNPFALRAGGAVKFGDVETLLDKYNLLELDLTIRTDEEETEAIGSLARELAACYQYSDTPEPIAQALARGLSLEGAGEALSLGAATIYLGSNHGNPMDAHLHTGSNTRRYLMSLDGVSKRNKILALLTGLTGPECVISKEKRVWDPYPDMQALAALPKRDQGALLDAITESIENQPQIDWSEARVASLTAQPQVKETILLAQQYAENKYDPMALFRRLGEFICRDDFTEMHALKLHQAAVDEFDSTREPFRWMHLVSAAKSAAVIHGGKEDTVYRHILEFLK